MKPEAIKSYLDALGAGLQPLAEKLGTGAEKLFQYALARNYAEATFDGVIAVACVGVLYTTAKNIRRWFDADRPEFGIPAVIASILAIICGPAALYDLLCRLLSPEYSTLQDLFKLLHGAS